MRLDHSIRKTGIAFVTAREARQSMQPEVMDCFTSFAMTGRMLAMAVVLSLAACAAPGSTGSQATLRDASSLGLGDDAGTAVAVPDAWWREFGDAQLNRLIDSALASNPSLKIAQARLARVRYYWARGVGERRGGREGEAGREGGREGGREDILFMGE